MTLQAQIDSLKLQIENLEAQQARCSHEWSDVEYAPRFTGGYKQRMLHGPGPLENHPEIYIPREEHPRWKRVCTVCGLVQHTERTKETKIRGKIPGTTATENVPVF